MRLVIKMLGSVSVETPLVIMAFIHAMPMEMKLSPLLRTGRETCMFVQNVEGLFIRIPWKSSGETLISNYFFDLSHIQWQEGG